MANSQRDAEALAITGTEHRPRLSIGRQPVVDMNCRQIAKAEAAQHMEQDNGIATAGQPHPKTGLRLETGGEKSADPLPKIS